MRLLAGGVHAGVGTAGAVETDRLAHHPLERGLDHLLHAERVDLALPAGEAAAEIGERQPVGRAAARACARRHIIGRASTNGPQTNRNGHGSKGTSSRSGR